jgi:hypothetical protein
MFVGHYGVPLAAKRFAPRASLGALFLAAQLVDILFVGFFLAGVEKARIVPGFTRSNPYDVYFMPYSHSLPAVIGWAALAALVYGLAAKRDGSPRARVGAALAVGAVVLSHFVLDWLVHVPDLPLGFAPDAERVGLGLWNQIDVSMALELGTLIAGAALYVGGTRAREGTSEAPLFVFIGLLIVFGVATPFLPEPVSLASWAVLFLAVLIALPAVAEWIDRGRKSI